MDGKELLLKLCEGLTQAVEKGYKSRNTTRVGDVLMDYGTILWNIGWVLKVGSPEKKNEMFERLAEIFTLYDKRKLNKVLFLELIAAVAANSAKEQQEGHE